MWHVSSRSGEAMLYCELLWVLLYFTLLCALTGVDGQFITLSVHLYVTHVERDATRRAGPSATAITRREQLTERFFRRSVLPETSCLHYLLPSKHDVSVTSRLRHARTWEHLKCRTVKFQHSFIPYCLDHYV